MNLPRLSIRGTSVVLIAGALGINVFASLAQAGTNCSTKDMKGTWMYDEHGTHVTYGSVPFSEVGYIVLNDNGTGMGETFLSLNGAPIPNPNDVNDPTYQTNKGIPIVVTEINIDSTCAGRATFVIPGDEAHPRTIRFMLDKNGGEFRYISTTGDITIVGNGKRID
jgi:hypothetical protein